MANQQTLEAGAKSRFNADDMALIREIVSSAVEASKKPYVDQDEVAKKERARQRLRDQRKEAQEQIEAIQNGCNHLRDDNTSRVAWITNFNRQRQLYITEGFCQLCNKHYHPGMKEGSAVYEAMLRVPVGKAGIIS